MKIHSRFERLYHADIRRLLLGIIVTVGLVVLLVQFLGVPSFRWSQLKVSVIDLTNSNVTQVSLVKTETSYLNLTNDDDGNSYDEGLEKGFPKKDIESVNDVTVSKEKVEINVIVIARPNISMGTPKMVVESSTVLVRGNDSRKGNVLSMMSHNRGAAISISQMNSLLIQSLSSLHSPKPRRSSPRDSEMLSAKSEIENAAGIHKIIGLNASIYRNITKFQRSYDLMERKLKIYVYKEGGKPIFHKPKPRGIYASEGWFMKLIESNKKFVVKDPRKAHFFYIPISIKALRSALGGEFQTPKNLADHLKEYLDLIAGKYKFWNRTSGVDHFVVACHDWGNKLTKKHMKNSVRALCNSNVAQGFRIGTDTALPVTYIRSAESPLE